MKTITVTEALKQGYTLCGYEDLEMQGLKNIGNLDEEDFEPHHGYLCVANKQSNSASISSEEIIEWLTDRYYDTEGNTDDDTHDMELCFKEKTDITEEFIQNPMQYKFAKLREKLFFENKDLLTKTLTDEAIMLSVENVIENYTHRNYQFDWRWKDAIVKIIGENWHKFKDDERVNNGLLRQIENLKSQVNSLQQKLNDVENVIAE